MFLDVMSQLEIDLQFMKKDDFFKTTYACKQLLDHQ